MPKPAEMELGDGTRIIILHEDRSVLAIDKPRGWMLVPYSWQKTNRNLQAALVSSIAAGHFWARSRGIRFLRHVHRLDADTTGVLLLAKSRGALDTFSELFESRRMNKVYLAVTHGEPQEREWTCRLKLSTDPPQIGRMRVDARTGKEAETQFKLLATRAGRSLIEARPVTGRTHQIRVHLAESGLPIVGDELYGKTPGPPTKPITVAATVRSQVKLPGGTESRAHRQRPEAQSRELTVAATLKKWTPSKAGWLGLRAVELSYEDPFTHRTVRITAPREAFLASHGFEDYGK